MWVMYYLSGRHSLPFNSRATVINHMRNWNVDGQEPAFICKWGEPPSRERIGHVLNNRLIKTV